MGITQIIVPSRLNRTQVRRKFKKSFPNRVVTKIVFFPKFKGRKGVAIEFRKRKKK